MRSDRPPRFSPRFTKALGAVIGAALAFVLFLGPGAPAPPSDSERGAALFRASFTPERGLGPLFNEQACSSCHLEPEVGGVGSDGLATALRVGRLTDAGFDPMLGRGGPFARTHSVSELGVPCDRSAGIPAGANVTSVRNAPALFGTGLIEAIPEEAIRAGAQQRRDGVSGRPNLVPGPDGRERVGRFGWKAETPTLEGFVAEALRNELGVTSLLAPAGSVPTGRARCVGESASPEASEDVVRALSAFVASLPASEPRARKPKGEAVFVRTGCNACHVATLGRATRDVPLYSDLLLHDMGRALDDRVVQGSARGAEWRTAPLWGLSSRPRYLHDGRADSIEAAIVAHGGEAARSARRFARLPEADRRALLDFLRTR